MVGSYGWGRIDMVENRRVGIKSRETYECPAAMALLLAHRDLEDITLERDVAHEKLRLEIRWAELVYDGLWFSPLKEALDAFFESTQRHVTGEVRLSLAPGALSGSGDRLPGSCIVNGRRSPASLYEYDLATYDSADTFQHKDAEGFVRLWGLGIQTWAARQGSRHRGLALRGRLRFVTLWEGRLGEPAAKAMALSASLSFDKRLAPDDIAASRAHVRGLARGGIITDNEAATLVTALDRVSEELASGSFTFKPGTRTSTRRSNDG